MTIKFVSVPSRSGLHAYLVGLDDDGNAMCTCPGYTYSAPRCKHCPGVPLEAHGLECPGKTTRYEPNIRYRCAHIKELLDD